MKETDRLRIRVRAYTLKEANEIMYFCLRMGHEGVTNDSYRDCNLFARNAFEVGRRCGKAGTRWADEHPKSPWVPIDGEHPLPEIGQKVLLYYPVKDGELYLSERMSVSVKSANDSVYAGGYDEYGFPVIAENAMEATLKLFRVRATYWMLIPELPKGGKE